jgi:serine/threonine protein kinase
MLSQLNHSNIIKFLETYEDERYIYTFMEYIDDAVGLDEFINFKLRERT